MFQRDKNSKAKTPRHLCKQGTPISGFSSLIITNGLTFYEMMRVSSERNARTYKELSLKSHKIFQIKAGNRYRVGKTVPIISRHKISTPPCILRQNCVKTRGSDGTHGIMVPAPTIFYVTKRIHFLGHNMNSPKEEMQNPQGSCFIPHSPLFLLDPDLLLPPQPPPLLLLGQAAFSTRNTSTSLFLPLNLRVSASRLAVGRGGGGGGGGGGGLLDGGGGAGGKVVGGGAAAGGGP